MLRVLADRMDAPARFLILGSSAPKLLRNASESLAGRVAFHELGGLDLDEVGVGQIDTLWLRGRFALREIIRHTGAGRDEAYFWALH